jgi:hypothetical protein
MIGRGLGIKSLKDEIYKLFIDILMKQIDIIVQQGETQGDKNRNKKLVKSEFGKILDG